MGVKEELSDLVSWGVIFSPQTHLKQNRVLESLLHKKNTNPWEVKVMILKLGGVFFLKLSFMIGVRMSDSPDGFDWVIFFAIIVICHLVGI